jgi:hypothetical protein
MIGVHSGFGVGYHFKRTRGWQNSSGPGDEVSFELSDNGPKDD